MTTADLWLEEIFDGSRDGIFLTDDQGRFVRVNRAACELTGYRRDQLLGMKIPDLHDEADLDAFRTYFSSILSGAAVTSKALVRRKDGSKVPVEFSNRRIRIEGQIFMHTVARDITEREHEEAERERLIDELRDALAQVKTLSGIIPICAACKKIRNDQGYWQQVEVYVRDHSGAEFSHGVCPDCASRLYPDDGSKFSR